MHDSFLIAEISSNDSLYNLRTAEVRKMEENLFVSRNQTQKRETWSTLRDTIFFSRSKIVLDVLCKRCRHFE